MNKESLIQTVFLGFVIAVFFKVFDFIFDYPLSLIQHEIPYSIIIIIFFYHLILLLSLVTIIFFILGDNPKIIRLKNKELIQYFKKMYQWCFRILMIIILFSIFISMYLQGRF